MYLKWHGTASVELGCDGGKILLDPFVPFKGSDVDVKIEDFDGFTDILVTHGHFDHIYSLPEIVRRNPEIKVYCTKTPHRTLLGRGVAEKNLNLIGYGENLEINGFKITTLHGKHAVLPKISLSRILYAIKSKARGNTLALGRENKACPENDETVFYMIEAEGKSICIMGSLNLREEVEYPTGTDLLVLPYNGWDDNLPPAVSVIERLKPKHVVLDHYDDTFPPITMPVDLNPMLERYNEQGNPYITPLELNETVEL